MKYYKLLYIIISTLISSNLFAQLEVSNLYGTWQSDFIDGTQVFRVHLFHSSEDPHSTLDVPVQGHFEMVEIDPQGNETIIYTSNKPIWEGDDNYWWSPAIMWLNTDGTKVSGKLIDNCVSYYSMAEGCFTMTYVSSSPLKVEWLVDRCPGLYNPNRMVQIPTDLVLTKQ